MLSSEIANRSRFVTVTLSQVRLMRFIHRVAFETSAVQLRNDMSVTTASDFVEQMCHEVDFYRSLDDVLVDGMMIMEESGATIGEFIFTPIVLNYLLELATRPWKPYSFFHPLDPDEREKMARTVSSQLPDLLLSLKANSDTPVTTNVPEAQG